MAFTQRSADAYNEWKRTRSTFGPEYDGEGDYEPGSELTQDDVVIGNFEATSEDNVYDPAAGIVSLNGYYGPDPANSQKTIYAAATGAPSAMEDGSPVKWLNYDLLYIKSKASDKESESQKSIGFTHNQFPPRMKEDGEGIFKPEDYCPIIPVLPKQLDIIFWMDDIDNAVKGYVHGKVYVGVKGELNEDLEELESSANSAIGETEPKESNIRIAAVPFDSKKGAGTDALSRNLENYYDDPKRGWRLVGKCAIRLYSDVAKTNSGMMVPASDGMMLPVGIYPVSLGFSDNGKDRAWLPKIDASGSSLNLANLFIKGWTNKKLLVKVKNIGSDTVENGFTSDRIKPCYEIPAYQIKGETITMPEYGIMPNGEMGTRNRHEVIKWVEQSGYIRSHNKNKLESILTQYRDNDDVFKHMPLEMREPGYEIPYWKHDNGAIVNVYDYESFQDEFWYKLSSLLAACGGKAELSVLQKKKPSPEVQKASDIQAALDNPKPEKDKPQAYGNLKEDNLDDGLGTYPRDAGLESFVQIDSGDDWLNYKTDIPDTPLPEELLNEFEDRVKAFNERRKQYAKPVNLMAEELPDYDLSFNAASWAEDWECDGDEEEKEAIEDGGRKINDVWYDYSDELLAYKLTVIGNRQWFAENYKKRSPRDKSHNGICGNRYWAEDNGNVSEIRDYETIYGYAYTHDEAADMANEIKDDGWRVPTIDDWRDLLKSVNTLPNFDISPTEDNPSPNNSAEALRGVKEWKITMTTACKGEEGFNALPGGVSYDMNGYLQGEGIKERVGFIAAAFERKIENPYVEEDEEAEKEIIETAKPFFFMGYSSPSVIYQEAGKLEALLSLRFVRDISNASKQSGDIEIPEEEPEETEAPEDIDNPEDADIPEENEDAEESAEEPGGEP